MNPQRKSKPGKIRPVVVVQSTDTILAGSPGIVVVPVTSKLMNENVIRVRIKPNKNLNIKNESDCLLDQIHTVDRSYFIEELGFVSEMAFKKIKEGIRFTLDF